MQEKKTKIICTISDRRCEPEFIRALYEEGMNVVRINSAHTSPESSLEIVNNVRKVSDKIAILIDTKGPEIRLTQMNPESGMTVKAGDSIIIMDNTAGVCGNGLLYTNYDNFVDEVPVRAEILIDDGETCLSVESKDETKLICRACNDAVIKGRKSVNVPDVSIKLPALTARDREFIIWAIENNLDFVAHSFVRSAADLMEIENLIKERNSHLKIISKIENREGVENIDEILEHCYGIMVARGDLGVEMAAEKIPIIQKHIINKCRARKKPVIIATQMLHSMINNPRPTRAEISDIANAIFEYTDAIMLSGETANGKYPVEAVKVMTKVAKEVEREHEPELNIAFKEVTEPIAVVLAKSIVEASLKLPVKAFLIDTQSGRTGRYISAFRPNIPVYAKCYKKHVLRELALSYGIYADFMNPRDTKDDFVKCAVNDMLDSGLVGKDDLIGVLAGSFGDRTGASFIEISTVENMIS